MKLKTIFNQFPQKYTKCVCGIRYPKIETTQTLIYSSVFRTARAAKGNPVSKKTNRQESLLLMSDIGQVSTESSLCDLQISALLPHTSPFDSFGQ